MRLAIVEAEKCEPIDPDRYPKVGAIIAVGNTVIRKGHRGSGAPGDDDHAELVAIESVVERSEIPHATLYTTLEPCTADVRSKPLECCAKLIKQNQIPKVFIGILDPNQGVRGKGLWDLQHKGVEVELFPPKLAKEIRVLMDRFIRAQLTLGIRLTSPKSGETIKTTDRGGVWEFKGDFINPPGEDVFALTSRGNQFWPQPYSLRVIDPDSKQWAVKMHFGGCGPHKIYIVKANELGIDLVKYSRRVTQRIQQMKQKLKGHLKVEGEEKETEFLNNLGGEYVGIETGRLPKGLELQDAIDIEVV
jgi:pyrimidine deaminase RibD-like protein